MRLDQRNALARKLVAQARVLGPDFHASKYTQPVPTTTEYDKDGQVVRRSVTHEKLAELEAQIERGYDEIVRLPSAVLPARFLTSPSSLKSNRLNELCTILAELLQLYVNLGMELPSEHDPDSFDADSSLVITTEETQVLSMGSSNSATSLRRQNREPGTPEYYESIFAQYVASVAETSDLDLMRGSLKDVEPTSDVFDHFNREFAEVCLFPYSL